MAVNTQCFFEHIDTFMDWRKMIYEASSQTIKSNKIDIELFKNFVLENNYPFIDGQAVIKFQYYLKKDRKNCGGSINRKIFTLRSYSHFLRLQDVASAHELPFYDVLKNRQGYRNRPDALTHVQISQLFDSINKKTCLGIRDYAVYALMYQAGLRVGEVFNLDIGSIDFGSNKLRVLGKGNKPRSLHMNNELRQILSEWIAIRPCFYKSKEHEALFVSKKGNRLAIRTMEDNFKKLVQKNRLNAYFNVTCHTLRHTFASHLNDKDVDILVLQSLLGHSTPKSTQAYIHPSQEKIREAMEKLPGVIYVKQLIESGMIDLKFQ